MHAESKKATQTSKAADNEREGVLYLNSWSKRHMYSIRDKAPLQNWSVIISLMWGTRGKAKKCLERFLQVLPCLYFRMDTEDKLVK